MYSPIKQSRIKIDSGNRTLGALYSTYKNGEMDFDAEYQRGFVWTDEQKQNLLKAFFSGHNIGNIIFIEKPQESVWIEVLDGKQRLSTLLDFVDSKINYFDEDNNQTVVFNQLDDVVKRRIKNMSLQVGHTQNLSREEKIQYFLALNFAGIPQTREHLEYVKSLL